VDRWFRILLTLGVTLFGLVNSYLCFEGLLCLRNVTNTLLGLFNPDDEGCRSNEMSVVYASQHCPKFQKTCVFSITAVGTWNIAFDEVSAFPRLFLCRCTLGSTVNCLLLQSFAVKNISTEVWNVRFLTACRVLHWQTGLID